MNSSSWNTRLTLLERVKNSSDEAAWVEFENYYRKFIQMVLRQMKLRQDDLEDLTQDVLLQIWKKIPELEYDETRARFRTWMTVLIRNKVIDHYRKEQSHSRKQEMIMNESGSLIPIISESELDKIFQREWESHIVALAMERISLHFSNKAMQAFQMSMDRIPYVTIADELGIKENTVAQLKKRVKSRLIKEINRLKEDLEF